LRIAFYADDGKATPTAETQEAVLASARICEESGMRVAERRPDAIQDARAITERYWVMEELPGEQVVRLFGDWDDFRSRMLLFMRDYDIRLCPVDYRPAPPHPVQVPARDPDSGTSAFHGAADPLRFNYTLPFSLCGYPSVVVRAGTSPDDLPIGVQVV